MRYVLLLLLIFVGGLGAEEKHDRSVIPPGKFAVTYQDGRYIVARCKIEVKPGDYSKQVGADGGGWLTLLSINGQELTEPQKFHEYSVQFQPQNLNTDLSFCKKYNGKTVWLCGSVQLRQDGVPFLHIDGVPSLIPSQGAFGIYDRFVIFGVMSDNKYEASKQRIADLSAVYNKTVVDGGAYAGPKIGPMGTALVLEGEWFTQTDRNGVDYLMLRTTRINGIQNAQDMIVDVRDLKSRYPDFKLPDKGEKKTVKLKGYAENFWIGTPPAEIVQSLLLSGKDQYDKQFEPYCHTAKFIALGMELE